MWYKDHDYQVGDVVRFRQWEDMKSEFGASEHQIEIPGRPCFSEEMKHLCGTKAVITKILPDGFWWEVMGIVELGDFENCGDVNWSYTLEMLEPAEEPYSFDEGGFLSMLG